MEKIIVYHDCDGVLLNTIDMAKVMAKEQGIDYHDFVAFNYFFRTVDWNVLIYRAGILDNSIAKVKRLLDSDIYLTKILTKKSGNENEELVKRRLFAKLLPEVEVITLELYEHKDEVVNPLNHILIEDDVRNALRWDRANKEANGYGVGVIFNKQIKPDYENNIIDDIAMFQETEGVKKLLKYRGYR